jgi:hypothetical protein
MAISNYGELKTAVANWLDRSDLTARIPEFISLAESRINRNLRIRAMESKQTASTIAGQQNLALPAGFLQMRNVQVNTSPVTAMQYVSPEMFDRLYGGRGGSGTPQFYSVIANEMQLGPTPASVQTIEMVFYKKFDALSADGDTNWVLTNAPDLYLYGALLDAEPFLMNDQRVGLWQAAFDRSVIELQDQDDRDRHSGSAMRISTATGSP